MQKELAGKYLIKCYNNVKVKVDAWLAQGNFNCLMSNGWSSISNEAVINYMPISTNMSLFLKSKYTGDQDHSASFLAKDMSQVIMATPGSIGGETMGNTLANKSAWDLLKKEYPGMFFKGCVLHGLHLLVKDTFSATKKKECNHLVADYPEGYPFKCILDFVLECKNVAKLFHSHQAPKAQLKVMLKAAKLKMLAQMTPSCWNSIKAMADAMLAAKAILHQWVTMQGFISGYEKQKAAQQVIHDTVMSANFVNLLQMTLMVLKPINTVIIVYQLDTVPVSDVFYTFASKIPSTIMAMPIPCVEINNLMKLC